LANNNTHKKSKAKVQNTNLYYEDNGVEDIIVDGKSGECESVEERCSDNVPVIGFEKKNEFWVAFFQP